MKQAEIEKMAQKAELTAAAKKAINTALSAVIADSSPVIIPCAFRFKEAQTQSHEPERKT